MKSVLPLLPLGAKFAHEIQSRNYFLLLAALCRELYEWIHFGDLQALSMMSYSKNCNIHVMYWLGDPFRERCDQGVKYMNTEEATGQGQHIQGQATVFPYTDIYFPDVICAQSYKAHNLLPCLLSKR